MGLIGVWGSALKWMVASVALLQADTSLILTGCTCCAIRNATSRRYRRIPEHTRHISQVGELGQCSLPQAFTAVLHGMPSPEDTRECLCMQDKASQHPAQILHATVPSETTGAQSAGDAPILSNNTGKVS